ncbi:hypothetical protein CA13_65840 [Planctomycetes bacterium CA13]|uniref:Uncharacterized protein n=1 Tax=Novipirellula herctigrandis TaxID=2527986 RepID=A0A5C5ZCQ3_9BACT|nr:hypothetical protein CA13_65840 [Planctomycetes bacterium CA13]
MMSSRAHSWHNPKYLTSPQLSQPSISVQGLAVPPGQTGVVLPRGRLPSVSVLVAGSPDPSAVYRSFKMLTLTEHRRIFSVGNGEGALAEFEREVTESVPCQSPYSQAIERSKGGRRCRTISRRRTWRVRSHSPTNRQPIIVRVAENEQRAGCHHGH